MYIFYFSANRVNCSFPYEDRFDKRHSSTVMDDPTNLNHDEIFACTVISRSVCFNMSILYSAVLFLLKRFADIPYRNCVISKPTPTRKLKCLTCFRSSFSAFRKPAVPVSAVRFMGTHLHHGDKDVVIPDLVDSLEWVLDSPPNVHQFDEPPVSLLYF